MSQPRFRFGAFVFGITLVLAILLGRLVQLQILGREAYSERADGNRLRIILQPAPRGVIRDRNGIVLATSRLSYAVTLYPIQATKQQTEEVIARLSKLLGMSVDEIRAKRRRMGAIARPLRIKTDIDPQTIAVVAENESHLPGVSIEPITIRYYPKGRFLAHVLGYTGEITDQELATLGDQGYRAGDIIGKTGIEKVFDDQLRGEPGREQIEVDARGKPMRILASVPPVPGHDLTLTIDANLQAIAEKGFEGHRGALVAMDPQNGEVLAMASAPSFDPNWFAGRITPAEWKQLSDGVNRPMLNRALASVYPPGSIFKIVTHVAALELGKTNPSEHWNSTGVFYLGSKVFHDWKKGGFGRVDLKRALAMSIDTVYYELGLRVGENAIARYARALGLGRPTGIVLPHERSGLIPDEHWKWERFHLGWYKGETVNMSIGQGYVQVSPLQAAVYISAVANGGIVKRPKLTRPPSDAEKDDPQPPDEGASPLHWQASTWAHLRASLAEVVNAGTGQVVKMKGIQAGAKSGSAQAVNGAARKTHGWFVAFAPMDHARIAVAAIMEEAGHGGSTSGPVVAGVMHHFFGLDATASVPASPSIKVKAASVSAVVKTPSLGD